MIQFDPDIIDLDNEAAFGKPKTRVKIYSDNVSDAEKELLFFENVDD
jgi:hypothetical protein